MKLKLNILQKLFLIFIIFNGLGVAQAEEAQEEASTNSKESSTSSSSSFEIGPSIKIGIPHPINLSLDAKFLDYFSAGVGGGTLPFTISDVKVRLTNYDSTFRYHPFAGSWFTGVGFGYHQIVGVLNKDISVSGYNVPTTITAQVKSLYVIPHLGWLWQTSFGLIYGVELGVFLPISPKTDVKVDLHHQYAAQLEEAAKSTSDYQKGVNDVNDQLKKVGKQILPYITLIRFGWMF